MRLSAHAPKGGVTVAGQFFQGGEFIPAEVLEHATPAEQAAVRGQAEPGVEDAATAQAAHEWRTLGVRAPRFKAWFGDWEHDPKNASKVVDPETGEPQQQRNFPGEGSKVTDAAGRPTVVYHGTGVAGWDTFDKSKQRDPEKLMYGPGFYFSAGEELARVYLENAKAQGKYGEVKSVYLNIRNPFHADGRVSPAAILTETGRHEDAKQLHDELLALPVAADGTVSGDDLYATLHGTLGKAAANDLLRAAGYDGITHSYQGPRHQKPGHSTKDTVWIAFEPTQIKAVDNRGTFDASTGNIRLSTADVPAGSGLWHRLRDAYHGLLERLRVEPPTAPPHEGDIDLYLHGEWLPVESSNVRAIRYIPRDRALEIEYRNGGFYAYHDIAAVEAEDFALAPSKGKWVWDVLRLRPTTYGYQKPYVYLSGPSTYVPKWFETEEGRAWHGRIPPSGKTDV